MDWVNTMIMFSKYTPKGKLIVPDLLYLTVMCGC